MSKKQSTKPNLDAIIAEGEQHHHSNLKFSGEKDIDSENSENSENLTDQGAFRELREEVSGVNDELEGFYNGVSGVSGVSGPRVLPECDSEPFPKEVIGGAGEKMIHSLVDYTGGKMPRSLPAIAVLGTLSAAIGPQVRIRSTGSNNTTGGNLYLLGGAASSSGKSFVFGKVTNCLTSFDRERQVKFTEDEKPELESDLEMLQRDKQTILKKREKDAEDRNELVGINKQIAELERKIQPPRLVVGDITSQQLVRLMSRQRNECLSSMHDEARGVLDIIMGRYAPGDTTDESFYNHAWSGSFCTFDRASENESVVMQSPWLNCLWFTQPDKLREVVGKREVFQSGFVQRMLMCDTGSSAINLSKMDSPFSASVEKEWGEHIHNILNKHRVAERDGPLTVLPANDTFAYLVEYQDKCVEQMNGELSDISTIAGKWGENAWRVALCLHVSMYPDDPTGQLLELETAERAVKIVEWFAEQSLQLMGPIREEKEDYRVSSLTDILSREKYDQQEGVTYGVLRKSHGFTQDELDKLCAIHSGRFESVDIKPTSKGGRPTKVIRLK